MVSSDDDHPSKHPSILCLARLTFTADFFCPEEPHVNKCWLKRQTPTTTAKKYWSTTDFLGKPAKKLYLKTLLVAVMTNDKQMKKLAVCGKNLTSILLKIWYTYCTSLTCGVYDQRKKNFAGAAKKKPRMKHIHIHGSTGGKCQDLVNY